MSLQCISLNINVINKELNAEIYSGSFRTGKMTKQLRMAGVRNGEETFSTLTAQNTAEM